MTATRKVEKEFLEGCFREADATMSDEAISRESLIVKEKSSVVSFTVDLTPVRFTSPNSQPCLPPNPRRRTDSGSAAHTPSNPRPKPVKASWKVFASDLTPYESRVSISALQRQSVHIRPI